MSVSVFLGGTLKDVFVYRLTVICTSVFQVTRSFDGCQNINLTFHVEDTNKFVLTDVWDSKQHYEMYLAFRTDDGTIAAFTDMCVDGPTIDIFNITGA